MLLNLSIDTLRCSQFSGVKATVWFQRKHDDAFHNIAMVQCILTGERSCHACMPAGRTRPLTLANGRWPAQLSSAVSG